MAAPDGAAAAGVLAPASDPDGSLRARSQVEQNGDLVEVLDGLELGPAEFGHRLFHGVSATLDGTFEAFHLTLDVGCLHPVGHRRG